MSTEGPNSDHSSSEDSSRLPRRKKRLGELVRERALYAAPTIIIVYPLVGFTLGYLTVRFWHWPFWVPILTMVMGLVQAIRELHSLSRKIYGKDIE